MIILQRLLLVFCTSTFFVVSGTQEARSQSWRSEAFIQDLLRQHTFYAFPFWVQGLSSVSRIEFDSDRVNQYRWFLNAMTLDDSMSDESGRLLTVDEMGPMSLGTLAHESYHAYLQNFVRQHSAFRNQKEWLSRRATALYRELPKGKAETALEEAYASFLDISITSHRTVSRILKLRATDEEQCERSIQLGERLWKSTWDQPVYGYYYRESVGEYWTDQAKRIWARVRGVDDGLPVDGAYFVETSLNQVDRNWVAHELFRGRIQNDFDASFEHLLIETPCWETIKKGEEPADTPRPIDTEIIF